MPNAARTYVRCVDAVNRRVGRAAMYLIAASSRTRNLPRLRRTRF